MSTLEEVRAMLREDPEFVRIYDLMKPYYDLMTVVSAFTGISRKDRFRIVALIERMACKLTEEAK
jgi:hypothetical protein